MFERSESPLPDYSLPRQVSPVQKSRPPTGFQGSPRTGLNSS
jgi:hypothetical protein